MPKSRLYTIAVVAVITIIAIVVFMSIYLLRSRAGGANASVDLIGAVSATTGSTFTMPVIINSDGADLAGADIVIRFDPAAFQVVDLVPQPFLSSGFTLLPQDAAGNFDKNAVIQTANSSGVIQVGAVTLAEQPAVNGTGIVGIITFQSLRDGTSDITVEFSPGATNDSNLILTNGLDTLAKVTNATVTSTSSGGPTDTPTPVPSGVPTPTDTPIPSVTSIPATPTPTLTPAPTIPGVVTLDLKLKFHGILTRPVAAQSMPVQVTISGGALSAPVTQQLSVTSDTAGVFTGSVSFPTVPAGSGYRIFVKGPKHLSRKICSLAPTETTKGSYKCQNNTASLAAGSNVADFTGITLMAGDLPDANGVQDGIINRDDIALVRTNLASTDPTVLSRADLNLDGSVTTQDYSLLIESLTVRFDEE